MSESFDQDLERMRARAEVELELELRVAEMERLAALRCRGCWGPVTARYEKYGVCRDCYNTTDDPEFPRWT
jgi:hypothetical protein